MSLPFLFRNIVKGKNMLHALSIDTVGFNGLPHEAGISLLSYFNWEECTGVGLQRILI